MTRPRSSSRALSGRLQCGQFRRKSLIVVVSPCMNAAARPPSSAGRRNKHMARPGRHDVAATASGRPHHEGLPDAILIRRSPPVNGLRSDGRVGGSGCSLPADRRSRAAGLSGGGLVPTAVQPGSPTRVMRLQGGACVNPAARRGKTSLRTFDAAGTTHSTRSRRAVATMQAPC